MRNLFYYYKKVPLFMVVSILGLHSVIADRFAEIETTLASQGLLSVRDDLGILLKSLNASKIQVDKEKLEAALTSAYKDGLGDHFVTLQERSRDRAVSVGSFRIYFFDSTATAHFEYINPIRTDQIQPDPLISIDVYRNCQRFLLWGFLVIGLVLLVIVWQKNVLGVDLLHYAILWAVLLTVLSFDSYQAFRIRDELLEKYLDVALIPNWAPFAIGGNCILLILSAFIFRNRNQKHSEM